MQPLPFAIQAQSHVETGAAASESSTTSWDGVLPAKLPRRRSILESLRRGLRRDHDIPEVAAKTENNEMHDESPPLLSKSNPELRLEAFKKSFAGSLKQTTLSKSEGGGYLDVLFTAEADGIRTGLPHQHQPSASKDPANQTSNYFPLDTSKARLSQNGGTTEEYLAQDASRVSDADLKPRLRNYQGGLAEFFKGYLGEGTPSQTEPRSGPPNADAVADTQNTHDLSRESDQDARHGQDEDDNEEQNSLVDMQAEYQKRWILNLSMSFREDPQREKFFVTYAETPTKWRRLTISLDYRTIVDESLEADLKALSQQQDKSFRIFEAIRESLDDICYYDTVTNLKLESTDDLQLHIHVSEDANEIVHFPSVATVEHIACPRYTESDVELRSHLSGFTYRVCVKGRDLVMKEIPGPDEVDEFLDKVNAMDALPDVLRLEGLITDEEGSIVKGLLYPYHPRDDRPLHILSRSEQDFAQLRSPQAKSAFIAEPEVKCFVKGSKVTAFPDLGSARSIISHDFVRRNRIEIDKSKRTTIRTAVGSLVKTLGTARLPFQFAKERDTYMEEFHVLPKCLYDVILGNPFLSLTKTFSHFPYRIGQKLRSVASRYRVCFAGSSQKMLTGWVDGEYTLAIPDTGSDICVMSLAYAKEKGFAINTDDENRLSLEFVDGSNAETLGRVENFRWQFEQSDSRVHRPDVYVLEGLQTDLLLSYDFLVGSDAFNTYASSFIDKAQHTWAAIEAWAVSAIKVVRESKLWSFGQKAAQKLGFTAAEQVTSEPCVPKSWDSRKLREMELYDARRTAALALPQPQQDLALEIARVEWEKFWAIWPGGHGANS